MSLLRKIYSHITETLICCNFLLLRKESIIPTANKVIQYIDYHTMRLKTFNSHYFDIYTQAKQTFRLNTITTGSQSDELIKARLQPPACHK